MHACARRGPAELLRSCGRRLPPRLPPPQHHLPAWTALMRQHGFRPLGTTATQPGTYLFGPDAGAEGAAATAGGPYAAAAEGGPYGAAPRISGLIDLVHEATGARVQLVVVPDPQVWPLGQGEARRGWGPGGRVWRV